jgi:hypothetical protein
MLLYQQMRISLQHARRSLHALVVTIFHSIHSWRYPIVFSTTVRSVPYTFVASILRADIALSSLTMRCVIFKRFTQVASKLDNFNAALLCLLLLVTGTLSQHSVQDS